MVPFWVLNIIRHLIFKVPKRDPNFDNHPYIKAFGAQRPYYIIKAVGLF